MRQLAFGRARILILGFIPFPRTLTIYDIVHFLMLGGVDRDFPFTEDEPQKHSSYLSSTTMMTAAVAATATTTTTTKIIINVA